MPRLTPADKSLILDHVVGDRSVPTETARALLAALPHPSHPTPRLRRAILLRRLADDPLSTGALDCFHLLATLPSPSPALPAVHLAVAAFLVVSAHDFDAAARALFARPDGRVRRAVEKGGSPALASDEAVAVANQFEAAIGISFPQSVLKARYGDRAAVEGRVRELVAADWEVIGPSMLEGAAERLVGDNAIETWRAADEATRAKYAALVGEEKSLEIQSRLEETSSHVNPISTPKVRKVVSALETSVADLLRSVEDPLPAAKAAAEEVLAARRVKEIGVNAGSNSINDPTAQTNQHVDSPDPEQFRRLPTPRRMPVSPLQPPENRRGVRKRRKWSTLEEETLLKGVEEYGAGNWKEIWTSNPEVFIGRTPVDLKDKWRNMGR